MAFPGHQITRIKHWNSLFIYYVEIIIAMRAENKTKNSEHSMYGNSFDFFEYYVLKKIVIKVKEYNFSLKNKFQNGKT